MNAKTMVKIGKDFVIKHGPAILTTVGIAELVGTSYLWVKNTPKAQQRIADKQQEKGDEKLTKMETFKAAAPAYIPAASATVLTATTFLLANRISAKQMAALIAAYQLSEEARNEWKENTLKTVGQKKYDDIEESVARSRMQQVPATEASIINTGKGDTLFFDAWSGRYFYSSRQALHDVQLDLGDIFQTSGDICLNDYYDMINLDEVKQGNNLVWASRPIFKYTAVMHPTLGIACTQIDFVEDPTAIPF